MGDAGTIILSRSVLKGLATLSYDIVGCCLSNLGGEPARLVLYMGYLSVTLVGILLLRLQ